MNQPAKSSMRQFDATFRNSRREAACILIMWAICLLWTIIYCGTFAYDVKNAGESLVLGLPSWVFWGVAVPWAAAGLISIYYALVVMKDDELGDESSPKLPATAEETTRNE